MSGRAAAGASVKLSIARCRPSASRRWVCPAPKMLTIIGSTTVRANSAATAASTALPPAASISTPAADPRGWLATTMPRVAEAGRFSV